MFNKFTGKKSEDSLSAILSKRMITTFIYLGLVLDKLNILSKLFRKEKMTLTMAIIVTREAIAEFSHLVSVMFPEHSCVSTLMLILPLGSCAVERCFSYSTRIYSDSRSALTLSM